MLWICRLLRFFCIFNSSNTFWEGRKTVLKKAKNYAIPQITDF